MPRSERRLTRQRRFPIPRAYILADIAAENVLPDASTHILGHGATQLDREIGNAAPGIDLIAWACDRLSRAGIDAACASPAAVRRRSIVLDLERRHHFAQEEPGSDLLVDQTGIFADPAQARLP